MSTNELDPAVLSWRIGQIELAQKDHVKDVEVWRRTVDEERSTTKEQIKYMRGDISDLTSGFNGLRKALIGFALTIAVSCLVFALSILAATGKL